MKLLAILTFYITVYATLCVAGTKCRDVKCTIVADTQQNNLGKSKHIDLFTAEYHLKRSTRWKLD